MDIEKYRQNSSYYRMKNQNSSSYMRNTFLQQAIQEFELYQKYAPNTQDMYINGSTTPILGTLQDVSDLEIGSDSKWLLTSLKNEIFVGDVITIKNRKWICYYDKEKNTQNCFKVKIMPCSYQIKLPFKNITSQVPFIYYADSIITTYLTDIKEFKQPFPTEAGTSFVTMRYDEYTKQLKREGRLWIYDDVYKIVGVDYTNINHYIDKGCMKFTCRPENKIGDLDNEELGIADYYKIFPKTTNVPIVPKVLNLTLNKTSIGILDNVSITASNTTEKVKFTFDNDKSLGCTFIMTADNQCKLNTSREIGILYINAQLESDPTINEKIRIVIN